MFLKLKEKEEGIITMFHLVNFVCPFKIFELETVKFFYLMECQVKGFKIEPLACFNGTIQILIYENFADSSTNFLLSNDFKLIETYIVIINIRKMQ